VDPLAVAGVYDELAELASAAGHPGQSEQHRRRALTCRVAVLGAGHPEVVVTEAALAETLVELGRDEEADIVLRRTLERFEANQAPDSDEMAIAAHRLAGVMARRDDAAAVRLYQQALAISREVLGAGILRLPRRQPTQDPSRRRRRHRYVTPGPEPRRGRHPSRIRPGWGRSAQHVAGSGRKRHPNATCCVS